MWSLLNRSNTSRPPWGLKWRSSVWFITLVVGFGVATDLFVYAVIIPVVPFRLESLGYEDASARTGWLLFAYSGGLAVSTPPIAWFSERYGSRRAPLLIGLVCLLGAQVMFMLAPVYWLMALARIIQGISSTFVWTVGLALVCDTTPESRVGQQLGLAMTGLSAGVVLAPPIGGALYQKLGFHAPFIFSIGIVLVDLLGRLFVIERKEALLWGVDPAAETPQTDSEKQSEDLCEGDPDEKKRASLSPAEPGVPKAPRRPTSSNDQDADAAASGSTVAFETPKPSFALQASTHENASDKTRVESRPQSPVTDSRPMSAITDLRPLSTITDPRPLSMTIDSRPLSTTTESRLLPATADSRPLTATTLNTVAESHPAEPPRLTSRQVLTAMFFSPRALAAFANTLIYGITYSSQEPTLPLRLQDPYGMSSLKVGLVYIASSVPTLLSGPIAGWLADRKGAGLITIFCLLMSVPWFIVMIIHGPLALLIVGVVVANFFLSAVVAPLTAELAAVTRQLPGVGYSHVYGAFNLAYGVGSTIGPLIGGQLYDRVRHGWTAVVGLAAGLMLVAATVAFVYTGEPAVAQVLLRRWKGVKAPEPEAAQMGG